jgi:putative heme-binding domain-containing protein
MVDRAIEKLSKQYPAASFALNHELSQLLVWLDAPDVVAKTLALRDKSTDPAEQVWYAYVLREATHWTPEQRVAYFGWFAKAQTLPGGNSYPKFITGIRDLALAKVPADQKEKVAAAIKEAEAAAKPVASATPAVPAVAREFKQQWTMADLTDELPKGSSGRNFERGKEIFASMQCSACHRFNNTGGGVGPDISAVANRFSRRDVLESIIEPSKIISEQYASYVIRTHQGQTYSGQIVEETNDSITIVTDLLRDVREKIPASFVKVKKLSPVSTMPSGLLDVLTKEEILDLLAYIESGGNKTGTQFSTAK